jgi:O-antigen ligase
MAGILFIIQLALHPFELKRIRTSLEFYFLAFIIVEFISSILSSYPVESFIHARRVFLILVFYITLWCIRDIEMLRRTVLFLGLTVAIVSVVELILYIPLGKPWLRTFHSPMTTGGLKMITLLLLFPFYISRNVEFRIRLYTLLVMFPIYLSFLLTFTRSSWLGFTVGLLIIVLLKYRYFIPGWLLLVAVFYIFFPLKYKYKSVGEVKSSTTTVARFMMWQTGLKMFKDRPILGYGDIDLYKIYVLYRPDPPPNERIGHLHNNYIMWLVLFGVAGFIVLSLLFIRILYDEFLIFKEFRNEIFSGEISVSSLGIFFAFNINGLFDWNFGDAEVMTLFWFVLGLSYLLPKIKNKVS